MDTNVYDNEIPYHILARFGLTQEMIEDLPESTYTKLKRGQPTPLLPLRVKAENGDTVLCRSKLALVRNGDGSVRVIFYPKLIQTDLSRFNQQQQNALQSGEPIIAVSKSDDGTSAPAYYQIDPDTRQVMSAPLAVIHSNIELLAERLKLSKAEYIELYRVIDFRETESFMQGIFDLKTVTVYSGDRTTPKLRIHGIPAGLQLVPCLRERVNYNRQKRGIYEITNR